MKRTLRAAARVLGAQLIGLAEGADRPYSVVSSDSRTLGPGALFVALRGDEVRRRGVRRRSRGARRGGRHCRSSHADVRAAADSRRGCASRAAAARAGLARGSFDADRGGGRQQRQDHHQGNDGGDSLAHGSVPRDPWQSQQPHRRAADLDAPRAFASQRRDRDGRQSHRRCGRTRDPRAADRRTDHQCRRGAPGGIRRSRRRRQGRG